MSLYGRFGLCAIGVFLLGIQLVLTVFHQKTFAAGLIKLLHLVIAFLYST